MNTQTVPRLDLSELHVDEALTIQRALTFVSDLTRAERFDIEEPDESAELQTALQRAHDITATCITLAMPIPRAPHWVVETAAHGGFIDEVDVASIQSDDTGFDPTDEAGVEEAIHELLEADREITAAREQPAGFDPLMVPVITQALLEYAATCPDPNARVEVDYIIEQHASLDQAS